LRLPPARKARSRFAFDALARVLPADRLALAQDRQALLRRLRRHSGQEALPVSLNFFTR